MTAHSRAELAEVPGVARERDAATREFVFNHTMLRVKDAQASLDFYTRVLGFTLVRKIDFEQAKFSLYFLVLVDDDSEIPDSDADRRQWLARVRTHLRECSRSAWRLRTTGILGCDVPETAQ